MDTQTLIKNLESRIRELPKESSISHVGEVVEVKDGVALLSGLSRAVMGEMLFFKRTGVFGMALNLTRQHVGVALFCNWENIQQGDSVESTGNVLQVPVGNAVIGRVVDPVGNPLDGKGDVKTSETSIVEKVAPGVITRQSVHEP